jgi:hydroxyacylglutathione hydrolase
MTGAPIALHRDDAPLVATPELKIPPGRNAAINVTKWTLEKIGWLFPLETFAPDIVLDDGQSLREFGFDARVVHTPGHTLGSVSVLCDDGTCFAGDAILNLIRVSFPLYWENPRATHASARRIQSLQPRVCYTGHGRAFGLAQLDAMIERKNGKQNGTN